MTNVVKTSAQAIRDSRKNVSVGLAFHTDFHENLHHHTSVNPGEITGSTLVGPFSWTEALAKWIGYIDYVGINSFPYYYNSYFAGYANIGAEFGEKVALAKTIAGDKPIFITFAAYPIPKQGYSFPVPMDYTGQRQKLFLENAIDSSLKNGAKAFFWFDVLSSGMTGPSGGYTEWDLSALKTLGPAFRNGEAKSLIDWLLANFDNTKRLSTILTPVEKGWGLGSLALEAIKSRWLGGSLPACSDSDGNNQFTKSAVTYKGALYYDVCAPI